MVAVLWLFYLQFPFERTPLHFLSGIVCEQSANSCFWNEHFGSNHPCMFSIAAFLKAAENIMKIIYSEVSLDLHLDEFQLPYSYEYWNTAALLLNTTLSTLLCCVYIFIILWQRHLKCIFMDRTDQEKRLTSFMKIFK